MQFPTDSLRGRSIIVTGAASGIGLALARALLRVGAKVLAVDASAPGLDRFATEEPANADLHCMTIQLGSPDCGDRVAAQALKAFGRIDGLVNNAGLGRHAIRSDIYERPLKFWETTPEMWDRFIAVNSTAPFLLMRAVVPHMLAQKSGRIVNVTTSLSSMIGGGMSPYGPTKAAAEALTACAANDLQGTGVTANVVVPGATTDTGMVPASAPIVRENLARPEAMAPPVLWLLSDLGAGTTGMRFRANLWDTEAPVERAFAAAGQPVAWTSISQGQLVDLIQVKPQGDKA
jgi:NAD(P)-dependent dehydrogenase (short-subunit alcohol dehydrogenase family)